MGTGTHKRPRATRVLSLALPADLWQRAQRVAALETVRTGQRCTPSQLARDALARAVASLEKHHGGADGRP